MLAVTRPVRMPKVPQNKVGTLELYKRFPSEYDVLMGYHDCTLLEQCVLRHIGKVQASIDSRMGLRIADLGCGTGRILNMLLRSAFSRLDVEQHGGSSDALRLDLLCGYDKEAEMLKVAAHNITSMTKNVVAKEGLCASEDYIRFVDTAAAVPLDDGSNQRSVRVCLRPFHFDHVLRGALLPPHPSLHAVVCAWSLSYVMRAQWGGDLWHDALKATVQRMIDSVENGGVVILIETLGNGCEAPSRRNTMLDYLEQQFGFVREWVRTDYTFPSVEEGAALCKFFFAKGVDEAFKNRGSTTLSECTGIWTKYVEKRVT